MVVETCRGSGSELELESNEVPRLPHRKRPDHRHMARQLRHDKGGHLYHAMNRAVRGTTLFATRDDYARFEHILLQGLQRVPVRLPEYRALPNHWRMVVPPTEDGQLGEFMHWFEGTRVTRWHKAHGTSGTGAQAPEGLRYFKRASTSRMPAASQPRSLLFFD